MSKPKGWKDLPEGGMIIEAGNADAYNTGTWRSDRPIWLKENCTKCLFCWVFCPDAAIQAENGEMAGIDYKHCKGCGICAMECPAKEKAIVMLTEAEAQQPDAMEKAKAISKKMAEEKKKAKTEK